MIDTYIHINSNNQVKVIQYDGSVMSLHEIVETFKRDIIFAPSGIYINGNIVKLGYYIVQGTDIYSYSERNFKELYRKPVIERKFTCNWRIIRYLWTEVHRAPDMYPISVTNGVITMTSRVSKNTVIISENLIMRRINPEYTLNSIERKIIDMCTELI